MPYGSGGGSSSNALGMATAQARRRRKKPKKKDGGSGFLGTGIGPDVSVNLGIDNALRMMAGVPGGLLKATLAVPKTAVAAATGGDVGKAFSPLGEMGAHMTAGMVGALGDVVNVSPLGLPFYLAKDVGLLPKSPGQLLREAYNEGVRALVPGTAYDEQAVSAYGARSFGQRYREQGLIPAVVTEVGDAAILAGGATGAAGITARALGTETRAGAAALRLSEATRPYMTPLQSAYTKGVRPFTRAAMVNEEAALGLERPVAGPTKAVPSLGPKREAVLSRVPEPMQRALRWLERHSEARDWRRELAFHRRMGTSERHVILRGPHNAALAEATDLVQQEARAQGMKIPRKVASDMVAEAVSARIRGVDRFISPEGLSPEAQAAAQAIDLQELLADVGLRGKTRLPESLMTERVRAALDKVEAEYRLAEARDARAKATNVRMGMRGLEDMDATTPRLTRGQERLNREALKLANKAQFWRERIPTHMQAAYRRLAKAEAQLLSIGDSVTDLLARRDSLARELELLRKPSEDVQLPLTHVEPPTPRRLARQTRAVAGEQNLRARIAQGEAELRRLDAEIARHQAARERAVLDADAARAIPDKETAEQARIRGERIGRATQAAEDATKAIEKALKAREGVQAVLDTLRNRRPGETPQAALQRGINVAYKVRDIEAMTRRIEMRQQALDDATRSVEQLRQDIIAQNVPAAVKAAHFDARRARTLEKLVKSVEDTSPSNWPRKYQDLGRALVRLRDQVAKYPELAVILNELPQTWSETVQRMQALGIDPAYIGDLTENQVRQAVYGSLRLFGHNAGQEVVGSFRKKNVGRMSAANAVDRSAEALSAGFIQTVVEKRANMLVDTIDKHYARPIEPGTAFDPKVWEPWDPMRSGLLTGQLPDGKVVAGQNVRYVIPKQLAETIRAQAKNYNHGIWRSVGRVTSAWRAFVLTLSPRWYVNNTIGNTILATVEGVRLDDWLKAWKDFRATNHGYRWQESPGIAGHSMVSDLGDPTFLPKEQGRSAIRAAWSDAEGLAKVRATRSAIGHTLRRANEVVDEFARSAVYWKSIRKGLTPEQALERSYQALIDYGDLSPFEQSIVRSLIPFYAWQKGILKIVAQMPIDHPTAVAVLMRLGDMQQQHVSETMFGGLPVPTGFAGLIEGPGGIVLNPRGANPFQDSASLVTVDGLANSLNPFIEVLVRKALGAPEGGFIDAYRMDPYGLAIPDVNVQESLVKDIAGGVPIAQLVESVTGTGRVKAGPVQQTARFLGIPAMTEADIARARERVRIAAHMVKHQTPPPQRKRRKSIVPAALGGGGGSSTGRPGALGGGR